jgi:hypothetical protein
MVPLERSFQAFPRWAEKVPASQQVGDLVENSTAECKPLSVWLVNYRRRMVPACRVAFGCSRHGGERRPHGLRPKESKRRTENEAH